MCSLHFFFHFWTIPSVKVCTCVCHSEWVCPCLCEHASFSSPLAGTIACGEVLRSSQSWEQCEGRRVPQQEVVHARAFAVGERQESGLEPGEMPGMPQSHLASCNGKLSQRNPERRKWRIMFTVQWGGMSSWEGQRPASGADWIRATGIQWPKNLALPSPWGVEGGGKRLRPKYILSQNTVDPCVLHQIDK